MLDLPCRSVMVSVNEMDCAARKLIAIEGDGLRSSHAEISKEITHVVRFHRRIHALYDSRIHLLRICKWAVAVANDIEMPKVKIGSEPDICHHKDYAEIAG
ncbi:MAG: hypothetical protein ABI197_14410 [Granulicella sp.]